MWQREKRKETTYNSSTIIVWKTNILISDIYILLFLLSTDYEHTFNSSQRSPHKQVMIYSDCQTNNKMYFEDLFFIRTRLNWRQRRRRWTEKKCETITKRKKNFIEREKNGKNFVEFRVFFLSYWSLLSRMTQRRKKYKENDKKFNYF